jgi:hypothetical protein
VKAVVEDEMQTMGIGTRDYSPPVSGCRSNSRNSSIT